MASNIHFNYKDNKDSGIINEWVHLFDDFTSTYELISSINWLPRIEKYLLLIMNIAKRLNR